MIWARPEPGTRKPRFSRQKIAEAALRIADEEGFEAVSMRRVAAELGAAPMTLYNYVRTKNDLLALMHDAILGEVLVPEEQLPGTWREAVTAIACRVRAVLVRHPWAVSALQEAQPGPNAMRRFEQFLAATSDSGLSTGQKFDLLSVLNAYVFGNALITVESRKRADYPIDDPALVEQVSAFARAQMETGEFPHTAKLMAGFADGTDDSTGPPMDEVGVDQQFQRGLAAMLDGLTEQFAADRAGRAKPAEGRPAAG
ncbi:TetR/AcrR family transcriptional regulator C-terminal domain-containing protein [Catenulispora yoronensis]|uniref:TetR/AcrR family transcriptional regulator C-terminal domain-containing protein n=1 Tax=Catenulispora yoronensis TaxID=450799 RepID=A0ABN2UZ87_9ACTN